MVREPGTTALFKASSSLSNEIGGPGFGNGVILPGDPSGDGGRPVEGEEGLAQAGFTVEDGEAVGGEDGVDEPSGVGEGFKVSIGEDTEARDPEWERGGGGDFGGEGWGGTDWAEDAEVVEVVGKGFVREQGGELGVRPGIGGVFGLVQGRSI